MTYAHSATESVVAILQGTERDTGLDLKLLDEIANYFRGVRKKYAQFEGSLRGVDARILVAQVPGGMLTNMEKQLRDQGAADAFDEVLKEIPRVRKDLGYIPLVTPTSQIVGTQAVLNVLLGERYKNITKETQAILKGQYGATPIPVDKELQARVLAEGEKPITTRPANLIEPEMKTLSADLYQKAETDGIDVHGIEDVLTYALFPQVGLKFLENRGNPDAFEPPPDQAQPQAAAPAPSAPAQPGGPERYQVTVNGHTYDVEVAPGGAISSITPQAAASAAAPAVAAAATTEPVNAPLAGTIFKILVRPGQQVKAGEIVIVLEAMKMETEVRAPRAGTVTEVAVREGDAVELGHKLLDLA
jgi:oxaloacetate decarboxylase alpha subunit